MASAAVATTGSTTTIPESIIDTLPPAPKPPRRRKEVTEQPLFLRKTFVMLDQMSEKTSEIGGWMPDGQSFVIKNHKKFAESVIPQYFKHNNFSSFVRQLNFYGFKKVKPDMIFSGEDSMKPVEFKHPLFQRNKPELLSDIKRTLANSGGEAPPDRAEFEHLQGEVSHLNKKIDGLQDTIEQLKNMLITVTAQQAAQQAAHQAAQQAASVSVTAKSASRKRARTSANSATTVTPPAETDEAKMAAAKAARSERARVAAKARAAKQKAEKAAKENAEQMKNTNKIVRGKGLSTNADTRPLKSSLPSTPIKAETVDIAYEFPQMNERSENFSLPLSGDNFTGVLAPPPLLRLPSLVDQETLELLLENDDENDNCLEDMLTYDSPDFGEDQDVTNNMWSVDAGPITPIAATTAAVAVQGGDDESVNSTNSDNSKRSNTSTSSVSSNPLLPIASAALGAFVTTAVRYNAAAALTSSTGSNVQLASAVTTSA